MSNMIILLSMIFCLGAYVVYQFSKLNTTMKAEPNQHAHDALFHRLELALTERHNQLVSTIKQEFTNYRAQFDTHQLQSLKTLQESLQNTSKLSNEHLSKALNENIQRLTAELDKLTMKTDTKLKEISGQVEKRLTEGFEKTTATFTDIIKRLALIDEAQKKINELSHNVINLENILSDKTARGAFGEVQLNHLIRNVIPEKNFALQHTLSNGMRADCALFLPEPSGTIVIDAKFPLENFKRLDTASDTNRKSAAQQFRADLKKHIIDISSKYIIAGETSDGAVMFLPAEAIFAELHANFPDIIELAHKHRVWITSPTTMMAVLTTACAVLKDAATRQQVDLIREHLQYLSKDFVRFQKRMDNLARHIDQANEDVKLVHTSAQKISSRFDKIEKVELEDLSDKKLSVVETQEAVD